MDNESIPPLGELWIGHAGPIPIRPDDDERLLFHQAASKVAQAATTEVDLIALVLHDPNPIVRRESVPRLRARFPESPATMTTLLRARHDADGIVRALVYSALVDIDNQASRDALVEGLSDSNAHARRTAALGLRELGDDRAPKDPDVFASDPFTDQGA